MRRALFVLAALVAVGATFAAFATIFLGGSSTHTVTGTVETNRIGNNCERPGYISIEDTYGGFADEQTPRPVEACIWSFRFINVPEFDRYSFEVENGHWEFTRTSLERNDWAVDLDARGK